jgi:lysophospholipase L1-like esterase
MEDSSDVIAWRGIVTVVLIALVVTAVPAGAQVADGEHPERRGPERWEGEIAAIERRFAARATPQADVVFVGSSSIRRWNVATSFPGLDAVNHGFGGSHLEDAVHFFDRVVAPAMPRIVVLYAGDNDINDGRSPEAVSDDFARFLARVDLEVPSCERVIWVSIKPSIKRWRLRDSIREANERVRRTCAAHPKAEYADIWTPSLDEAGLPRRELLADDDLHLSAAGYALWAEVVGPLLR